MIFGISRTTVARKLIFLGSEARRIFDSQSHPQTEIAEFDDLETFEHTKFKPVSVTLMVEHKTRRILGFEVAKMPAKGLLAAMARKKYGKRKDEREKKRRELFKNTAPKIIKTALLKSDENPHYPKTVKEFFPHCKHTTFKGRRGCVVGQGELKRGGFDPLFSLNHTCAMFRANINRLFRRTWCTTKRVERLADHIAVYVNFHNDMARKLQESRQRALLS